MATVNGIEPPTVEVDDLSCEMRLSFGPIAVLQANDDGTGFVFAIFRKGITAFSEPIAGMTVSFDAQCKPIIESIAVKARP